VAFEGKTRKTWQYCFDFRLIGFRSRNALVLRADSDQIWPLYVSFEGGNTKNMEFTLGPYRKKSTKKSSKSPQKVKSIFDDFCFVTFGHWWAVPYFF